MRSLRPILAAIVTMFIFVLTVVLSCSKDKCDGVDCRNGGLCNGGKCTCPQYYYGDLCENRDDACRSVICKNGGACQRGKCICPSGTKGIYCDSFYRTEYVHFYQGNGTDSTTTPVTNYISIKLYLNNPFTVENNKMKMILGTSGNMAVGAGQYDVLLTTFSDTGTAYILKPLYVNNLCYTGSGVVSSSKISLTLTITDMDKMKSNVIKFPKMIKL